MIRPALLSRICGAPRMALLLFLVYGVVVVGCYLHQLPGLLAWLAVWAAVLTLRAMGRVRRYTAWAAKWQAVTEEEKPQRSEDPPKVDPPIAKKKRRGWRVCRFLLGAALLVIAFPFSLHEPESPALLAHPPVQTPEAIAAKCIWCGFCALYVWRLSRRRAKKSAVAVIAGNDDAKPQAGPDVVTCVVPLPSHSPSREIATRELPDYCARLIQAQHG